MFNETHPVYPQKKREPPQDAKTAAEAAAEASSDYPAASAGLSDAPNCPVHLLQHPRHFTQVRVFLMKRCLTMVILLIVRPWMSA